MKGNQIKKLRESMQLSAVELASLTGVQTSSVYRWESSGNTGATVEGMARQIFKLIVDLTPKEKQLLVKNLRRGGWMAALNSLFSMSLKKA